MKNRLTSKTVAHVLNGHWSWPIMRALSASSEWLSVPWPRCLFPYVLSAALAFLTSAVAQAPDPQTARPPSLWYHNGSTMYLVVNGSARQFHYENPRPGMLEVGARRGSLLFTGVSAHDNYEGTAYIFRGPCGQFPYQVSGPILDDGSRVLLQGQAPRVNERCQIIGYKADKLEFTLVASPPQSMPTTDSRQTAPSAPDQTQSQTQMQSQDIGRAVVDEEAAH
jgi:hypothetical protein